MDARSIALTETFARRRGLAVGDPFALARGDREIPLRVAALLNSDDGALDGNVAVMDIAAAQDAFRLRGGKLETIDAMLRSRGSTWRLTVSRRVWRRFPAGERRWWGGRRRRGETADKMLRGVPAEPGGAEPHRAAGRASFLIYNAVSVSVIAAPLGDRRACARWARSRGHHAGRVPGGGDCWSASPASAARVRLGLGDVAACSVDGTEPRRSACTGPRWPLSDGVALRSAREPRRGATRGGGPLARSRRWLPAREAARVERRRTPRAKARWKRSAVRARRWWLAPAGLALALGRVRGWRPSCRR
jgi:hypothetical protein